MNTPNYSQIKIAKGTWVDKLSGLVDKISGHFEGLDYKINQAVDTAIVSTLNAINDENQKILKLLGKVVSKDGGKTKEHEIIFPYVESLARGATYLIDLTHDNMRSVRDQYKGRQDFRKKDIYTMEGKARAAISVLTSFNEKLRRNKKVLRSSVSDELKGEFDRIIMLSHLETAMEIQAFFKDNKDEPNIDQLRLQVFKLLNESWLKSFRDTDARNFSSLEDALGQLVRWVGSATEPSTASNNTLMFRDTQRHTASKGSPTPRYPNPIPKSSTPPPTLAPAEGILSPPTAKPAPLSSPETVAVKLLAKTMHDIRADISHLKKGLNASKQTMLDLQEKIKEFKNAGNDGVEYLKAKEALGKSTINHTLLKIKYYSVQIEAVVQLIKSLAAGSVSEEQEKLVTERGS